MEIGKRLSPRYIFFGLYIFALIVYIIIGLQPVGAADYQVDSKLSIPSINLDSDVTKIQIENHELPTPETIVGSYASAENKILLIGHSSTVFNNLENISIGDEIIYDDEKYFVENSEIVEKEDVIMPKILSASDEKTIVVMTCAGEDLGNGDATHRLIVTAKSV